VLQQRDDLQSACRNTVAAAMRELGLKSCVCKRFKPITTQSDSREAAGREHTRPRLCRRCAEPQMGDRHHVSGDCDRLGLLAVVVDLFSRKAVGWSIGASLATELVSDALRQAIERPAAGLPRAVASFGSRLPVHERRLPAHAEEFGHNVFDESSRQLLRQCGDGAILLVVKYEWTNHERFANLEEARLSVFRYIETFLQFRADSRGVRLPLARRLRSRKRPAIAA